MKKTIVGLMAIVAFVTFSCNNAEKPAEEKANTEMTENSEKAEDAKKCCDSKKMDCESMMTVDAVLENYKDMMDKDITVCGKVSHICQHGGKRMFLQAENSDDVLVITNEEAFEEDNMGKKVVVTGKIEMMEMEAEHDHGHDHAEGEEHAHDHQHQAAHNNAFVVKAMSCKVCSCKSHEEGECDKKETEETKM